MPEFKVFELASVAPTMAEVGVQFVPSVEDAALMFPAELSMSYATTAFGVLEPRVLNIKKSPVLLVKVNDKPVEAEPLAVMPETVVAPAANVATETAPEALSETAMKIEFPLAAGANAILLDAPIEPRPVAEASVGAGSESACGMIAAHRPESVRTNRYDDVPACAQKNFWFVPFTPANESWLHVLP